MTGRWQMTRRTDRVAWGLVVGLAMLLLGGAGTLVASAKQTGNWRVRRRSLADWRYWRLGTCEVVYAGCSATGSIGKLVGHTYSLGFVEVEVPYRGPDVILWNTFPRASL